ncbi:uncharacterized protein BDZ99DRAFT_203720 [Mytilinidion resinicola]|uniref:Uncharacterized protein n=1 Tax=Mytilinidion resinicola TaxID=574789 RepID=A0A6A6Y1B5_9PEZI|nr:uncharacterized protein BDZ99DRAFT_203720 [Mytilinidion resinicola]KAF2802440.1 hypothetical protein BDZ99DRAFT_203720 [Mytilinidion resinicola]
MIFPEKHGTGRQIDVCPPRREKKKKKRPIVKPGLELSTGCQHPTNLPQRGPTRSRRATSPPTPPPRSERLPKANGGACTQWCRVLHQAARAAQLCPQCEELLRLESPRSTREREHHLRVPRQQTTRSSHGHGHGSAYHRFQK